MKFVKLIDGTTVYEYNFRQKNNMFFRIITDDKYKNETIKSLLSSEYRNLVEAGL